jgi:hypothetical protein
MNRYRGSLQSTSLTSSLAAQRASAIVQQQRNVGLKRAGRPGQRPPARRSAASVQNDATLDYASDGEYYSDDDWSYGTRISDGETAWSQRVERKREHWQQDRPRNQQRLLHWQTSGKDDMAQAIQVVISSRVQEAPAQHGCSATGLLRPLVEADPDACAALSIEYETLSTRDVTYHGLHNSFQLPVPTVRCSCCQEAFEIQAADCGCFASSPVQPSEWYDLDLLVLYKNLTYQAGTSATTFAMALNRAQPSRQHPVNERCAATALAPPHCAAAAATLRRRTAPQHCAATCLPVALQHAFIYYPLDLPQAPHGGIQRVHALQQARSCTRYSDWRGLQRPRSAQALRGMRFNTTRGSRCASCPLCSSGWSHAGAAHAAPRRAVLACRANHHASLSDGTGACCILRASRRPHQPCGRGGGHASSRACARACQRAPAASPPPARIAAHLRCARHARHQGGGV